MSSPYLEETFHPFLETRGGRPAVTWVTEREPLGTGGAIVSVLDRLGVEPFLALNGDILTDLDLTAMLDRHRSRSAAVTIALHRVEDARAFGLVATDPTGLVTAFREKPPDPIPGDINAGTYVLDPSVLRGWDPGTYLWIEGEIFPSLIAEGVPMHGFGSDAYWLDLGTPEQYLRAHADLLAGQGRRPCLRRSLDRSGRSCGSLGTRREVRRDRARRAGRGRRRGRRNGAPPRFGRRGRRAGRALGARIRGDRRGRCIARRMPCDGAMWGRRVARRIRARRRCPGGPRCEPGRGAPGRRRRETLRDPPPGSTPGHPRTAPMCVGCPTRPWGARSFDVRACS